MEFRLNKGKIRFHLLITLIFSGACVALLVDPQFDTLGRGLGIFGLAVFGLIGIVLVSKLRDSRPGLVINNQGIWDNTSYFTQGLLPWSRIGGLTEEEIGGTKLIAIELLPEESPVRKSGAGLGRLLVRDGLSITLTNLDASPADIWQAIHSHQPK